MINTGSQLGFIILAAGASTRLGRPKQNLPFGKITLLEKIIAEVLPFNQPVVVVLGADLSLRYKIDHPSVHLKINGNWRTGMAGSIKTGMEALQALYPDLEAVLLLVCDQPFVTTKLLQDTIAAAGPTKKAIVASAYANTIGTPALFKKTFFGALHHLTGQEGAKKILLQHPEEVITIDFPEGAFDIDTPEQALALEKYLSGR